MTAAARAMPPPISVGRLADELREQIEALVLDLLPNGRRQGCEWVVGSLAGEPGRSLSIRLTGHRAGVWKDFAGGAGGDALDLVAACIFGGNLHEAIGWARQWLGHDDPRGRTVAVRRVAHGAAPARPSAEADAAAREKAQEAARRKFAGCQHRIKDTPADHYLRQRGIDLASLGRQPGRLAYHPALWCAETADRRPAMVAAIVAGGKVIGIHRTWLQEVNHWQTGRPVWQKARLENPKKTLGPWTGGCIPLWRGAPADGAAAPGWRELFERDDLAPGSLSLTIAEGIEDALTIATADPTRRVAAAISLAGLGSMVLPPAIGEVVIAADNDQNAAAQQALERAIDRHRRNGRRVLVARAPAPFKDFNEWLMHLRLLAENARPPEKGVAAR